MTMADEQNTQLEVLVAGCGIGGATIALALARQGVHVRILERAPVIAEVGAGLQLAPNAMRILRDLDVPKFFTQKAVHPDRGVMRDVDSGEEIVSVDFDASFVERYEAPYVVLHRGDLLTALMKACDESGNVEIIAGQEVVDVVDDGTRVTVRTADGSEFSGDALIGADGLRSRVRTLILGDTAPLASSYVIYRGTVPFTEDVEHAVTLFAGEHHHLMQYPIRGGEMVNLVCSFRSVRGEPGSDTWGTVDELREVFADSCPRVRSAVDSLDVSNRWVQFDRAPEDGWAQGRVTLAGDAAHATHQYLAQGACQAMEDAVVLADVLGGDVVDVAAALKEFEERRFPKASTVQRAARFWGELTHVGGDEAAARDVLLSSIGSDVTSYIDWIYAPEPHPLPNVPAHRDRYEALGSERARSK